MATEQPNESYAKRFFTSQLPRHIVQNIEKFGAQQGSISFYVRNQGKWTLRMGDLETPIQEGMDDAADLKLWFAASAFEGFIKGTLDVASAIDKEEIQFDGDVSALERFGFLLTASTSAIGTRFNR
ncbi:MAG: SCP2 sterol-binding domain-containing protein [Myxococcota bacterium]